MLSMCGVLKGIKSNKFGPIAIAMLMLLAAACGDGSETIIIDGSSTVFPISEAAAEEFGLLTGGAVRVAVGVSGTGGGFKKFCAGEIDITNASRPIKASEVELCAEAGVDFIEMPLALDGVTVMVNPAAEFVRCITIEELHTIWAPEAEGEVTNWNQVRPEWPDQRLQLYGPGVDSGTFDYFTETINGEAQASRGDFTASENDNVLVQGISGDKNSLGFFGYAYYSENAEKLKVLAVDGGDGCVVPSETSINDGSYAPLSRPLFLYVTKSSAETGMVQEFIRYSFSPDGQELASEVGYVPFPPQIYEMVLDRFKALKTGTLFGGSDPKAGTVEEILSASP